LNASPALAPAPAAASLPQHNGLRVRGDRSRAAYSAGPPAEVTSRDDYALKAGQAVMALLAKNLRPRDIVTLKALENAAAIVAATGGSTNAALHLPAIANEPASGSPLRRRGDLQAHALSRFAQAGGDTSPRTCGKGWVPMLLKTLLDGGFIHGDCMTVTGKTIAENVRT